MQSFKITDELEAICEWKKTRVAFKHEATLLRNGRAVEQVKICYQNRTWERYTYESVLQKLLSKANRYLSPAEVKAFEKAIEQGDRHDREALKSVAAVAALGAIIHGDDKKASNDWKARMLAAGLEGKGLIMPEDWETLSEDDKQARLDGAIAILEEGGTN